MEIMRRIGFNVTTEEREILKSVGINVEANVYTVVVVSENDDRWPSIEKILPIFQTEGWPETVFSDKDISSADFVRLGGDWHHGYPQPDDDFGYRKMTYDDLNYCETCGIRGTQKAPFRFSREPKWGRRSILALNWVYDELFVPPHIWESVFKPIGIQSREVLHHRTGKVLETVVQLDIPITHVGLDNEAEAFHTCEVCGRKKFADHVRGFYPPLSQYCSLPMFKVKDLYGSGASAKRPIIISKSLCAEIRSKGLKGGYFVPLAKKEFPPEQSKPC